MNQAVIIGHLGQDAEVRYTQSGQAVANLNVATNEPRGNGKSVVEWHRVIIFGEWVPQAAPRWKKGVEVFVFGKIQTRSFEDRNGQKREVTEVHAKTVKVTGETRAL